MGKIAKVKPYTIENGDGIRVSIFFSGCEHYCKNCFNSELWDFDVGEELTTDYYNKLIYPLINEYVKGISLLGGSPLHPRNIIDTWTLIQWFKTDFPDKDIWVYTGYHWEYLMRIYKNDKKFKKIFPKGYIPYPYVQVLENIDVLVDGKFIEEKKQLRLAYRGSTNQRIIDVQKSLRENKIVLYKE